MATATDAPDTPLPLPARLAALWLVALIAYGAGDTATTLAVVDAPATVELNPLVAGAISRFGAAGVVGLKSLAVAACAWLCVGYGLRDGDWLFTYGPPVLLVVLGFVTTAANLAILG
jgi:hypothetical protein